MPQRFVPAAPCRRLCTTSGPEQTGSSCSSHETRQNVLKIAVAARCSLRIAASMPSGLGFVQLSYDMSVSFGGQGPPKEADGSSRISRKNP